MCKVSHDTHFVFFLYKVVKLVSGGSVINGSTPSSFYSISCISQNIELTYSDEFYNP